MKVLITILFYFLILPSFAQSHLYEIGSEGGPSLVSLRGYPFNNKKTIGYSGGIFFQKNISKIVSFRTGAYYEQKGSSYEIIPYIFQGNHIQGNTKIDYLTIPFLCRATFGEKLKYFVDAGLYYGFLLKQNETSTSQINLNSIKFRNYDFGILGGVGILYSIKQKFALSLEVRNNRGLVNISRYKTVKSDAINFLIGFNYNLEQRNQPDSIRHQQRNVYFKVSFAPTFNFMVNIDSIARIKLGYLGIDGSPHYTYEAKRETGDPGHAVSALIEIRLIKRLFLDAGVGFERLNYKTKDNTVFYVEPSWEGFRPNQPLQGYFRTDNIKQQYHFISLPLSLNYTMPINKLFFSLGIGGSYNILYQFQTTLGKGIYNYPDPQNKSFNRSSSYSLLINIGAGYRVNKFLELGFGPQFKYYFTRGRGTTGTLYLAGYNSKANLYSIGLNFYIKI